MLSDGRFLVLAQASSSTAIPYTGVLMRFHADGRLDTSFGPNGDGYVYMDWRASGSTSGRPFVVALQRLGENDTRIVVAGQQTVGKNTSALRVERYSFEGHLDATFGSEGSASMNTSYAKAVAIQADGKILTGGSNAIVVRLNADGTPDSTFGKNGVVQSRLGINLNGIAVQSSGKIVVGGAQPAGSKNQFAVGRLNTDGSPDDGSRYDSTKGDSFGSGGKVTPFGTTSSSALRIFLDPSGRIVAGGSVGGFSANDWAIVRLNAADGGYDTSFSTDGRLTYDFDGAGDAVHGIVFQADGRIVVGGEAFHKGADLDFGIVRFLDDGSVDQSFGDGGRVWMDYYGGNDDLMNLMLQPDPGCDGCAKLTAVGFVSASNGLTYGAVARYIL